jgi:hypothetical protein
MPNLQIFIRKSSPSPTELPPRQRLIGRLKLAAIALLAGLLLIGLVIAVFVVGSVIAAVILILLVVSITVLMIKASIHAAKRIL